MARDLGSGPMRPFGSALKGKHGTEPLSLPLITERPIRPRSINDGRCPQCGDRYFGCGCEPEEE